MSEIKAGDLVMVVHICCGRYSGILGNIFKVSQIVNVSTRCPGCGEHLKNVGRAIATEVWGNGHHHAPVAWLKKIDPLVTPETEERDEEVTA